MFVYFATFLGADDATPLDEPEIQRLVHEARQGSGAAMRKLYAAHVRFVFRAIRGLCASDADAEDIVQDTFVRAFTRLTQYAPREGARFRSWLLPIALNGAKKKRRHAQRQEPLGPAHADAASDDALDAAQERKAMGAALTRALQTLPEREREIVSLRYGAELNASEISLIVGTSAANVRKICERQRQKLLALLPEWRAFDAA